MIASWKISTLNVVDIIPTNTSDTPSSLHTRLFVSNIFQSRLHLPAHQVAITMASTTEGIHKAAAEALQAIGDVKWNIACTDNAPPELTDLDDPLETIRMKVNWLKDIKEEQWNSL